MNTKEIILYKSLNLFAEYGYEAVGMREIANEVGIRQSSIYKHYAGKQEIMDSIVELALNEVEQMFEELHVPTMEQSRSLYSKMELDEVAALCAGMVLKQRENRVVSQFRKLLTVEQYRNEKFQKIFVEIFMNRQLEYIEQVFQGLLSIGLLKGESARMMAMEFYAPVFMMQYRFERDDEALKSEVIEYVLFFLNEHLNGGN